MRRYRVLSTDFDTCASLLQMEIEVSWEPENGTSGNSIMALGEEYRVEASDEFLFEVEKLFGGEKVVHLR